MHRPLGACGALRAARRVVSEPRGEGAMGSACARGAAGGRASAPCFDASWRRRSASASSDVIGIALGFFAAGLRAGPAQRPLACETFSTPARAVRSPFCLTCLRTAPTGGEEGGEPAGAVCARSPRAGGVRAVAARWWATAHRAERGASEEHTGQCAVRDSQIAKSNKKNRSSSCESSSTTNPAVVGISAPGAAGRAALRKAAGLPLASSRPAAP